MSWDERFVLVNRLCLVKMWLSEAKDAMGKAHKAFDEKVADLEQSIKVATAHKESASKRQQEALKDPKKADQRVEKGRKNAEEAIAKARECGNAIVNDWKVSAEGRTFLEDASLQASEIGHDEAL